MRPYAAAVRNSIHRLKKFLTVPYVCTQMAVRYRSAKRMNAGTYVRTYVRNARRRSLLNCLTGTRSMVFSATFFTTQDDARRWCNDARGLATDRRVCLGDSSLQLMSEWQYLVAVAWPPGVSTSPFENRNRIVWNTGAQILLRGFSPICAVAV